MKQAGFGPVNPPVIEQLLARAHDGLDALMIKTEILERSGISRDHLPDQPALMAFALLGDHERDSLESELFEYWQVLVDKGLARGPIAEASTPELRLLAHAQPFTDALDDVWHRLMHATGAMDAPAAVLKCPTKIQGYWGQPINIHFQAQGVECILIQPDELFSIQPALLSAAPTEKLTGSFRCHIDDGEIRFRLMHRSGNIYQRAIQIAIGTA